MAHADTDNRSAQLTVSRRCVVHLIGLFSIVTFAVRTPPLPSRSRIILIDGWILAETDLR
jgi:hypothetical protein